MEFNALGEISKNMPISMDLSLSRILHTLFLEKAPSNGFDIIKKPCKVEMTLNQNDKKRNIQMSISREPKVYFYFFLIFSPKHTLVKFLDKSIKAHH